jgi:2-aminoadipate transaminase
MDLRFSERMKSLESNAIREIFKLLSAPDMISFAGGFPAKEILPDEELRDIADYILSSPIKSDILQYGASEGYTPLRETAVKHMRRYCILAGVENITVVSGGQQTIDLTFKAFLNKGDAVLVEDPTYLACLHILKTYEAVAYGVKSDDDGINIEDLEAKIIKHNPKILYLVPTFSNPTGKEIPVEKRKAIAEITAKYGVIVLEDEPYCELRFGGGRLPSIKSFDRAGNVIFTSSFSKTISPGLRCGICVADERITKKIVLGKQATDVHTSLLSQAVINEYLNRGLYDAKLIKMIPYYKEKKDMMMSAIKKYMPECFKHTDPNGGLFIWGQFDADIDTAKLFPEAAAIKVAYVPGQSFYADGSVKNALRLNFSMAKIEDIEKGIRILGGFFSEKVAK